MIINIDIKANQAQLYHYIMLQVKIMKKSTIVLFCTLSLIVGCSAPSENTPVATQNPSPIPTQSSPNPTPTISSINTVPVTIYQIDDQCLNHIATEIKVSNNNTIEAAVGEVIKKQDGVDFKIGGYRLVLDEKKGIATVDLRVSPDSKRKLGSLSSCEQSALFGSLQKTLISNKDWKIKEVKFTSAGEELYF